MLDYRNIYLMRYGKTSKCKIGIAKNTNRRRRAVDKALPDKRVEVLFSVPVFFAYRNEQRLHTKYDCGSYRFRKIGKNGGGTEWTELNALDRLCVRIDLVRIATEQYLFVIFVAALLTVAALIITL